MIYTRKGAILSPDQRYRYLLAREWDKTKPSVCYVMVNPSTADANADDPTIHSCTRIAHANGFGSFSVVNLFALRSPRPEALFPAGLEGAIGPEGDRYLNDAIESPLPLILAWGNNGVLFGRGSAVCRRIEFIRLPREPGQALSPPVWHLGPLTAKKQPGHPLFLSPNTPLIPYTAM